MLYFFSALKAEADPLIRRLSLRRDPSFAHFQVYRDDAARYILAVTGPGPVRAAVTASAVFSCCPPADDSLMINIGVCAGLGPAACGSCYLCSSLENADSGRSFYPDLLLKHPFLEAPLITGSRVLANPAALPCDSPCPEDSPLLYDMEAAALYECGAIYLGPHQMAFLKIVSDKADGRFPSAEEVSLLIGQHLESILEYAQSAGRQIADGSSSDPDHPLMEQLARDLHCSETMKHTLRQYLLYDSLSGNRCGSLVREMYASGTLPCKDRKEGKKILAKLCSCII